MAESSRPERSKDDGSPTGGWTSVAMPVDALWQVFADVPGWPRWNACFRWVRATELREGATLVWVFGPVRPWLPYRLPAVARLIHVEPGRRVTWEVDLPGFHAVHSYMFEDAGNGTARFGSTEVADGPVYEALRPFWLAHFRWVCRESLAGAARLPRRGVRIVAYGRPSELPPLVVVPGLDGSAGSVAPVVERLAAQRRVLLADYTTATAPTLETLADEIAARTREVVDGPFDLLGQSIGTVLAARLATRPGLQPRRVVLVSTFTRLRTRVLAASVAVLRITPRWLYARTSPALMRLVCGPVGDGGDHPLFDAVRDSSPEDARTRTGWEVGRDFSVELSALAATGVPALVLVGGADRFVPDVASVTARLRSLFGPSAVHVVPGAGHVALPSAAVDEVVQRVERFLGTGAA